jgi:hypothetical protein
MYSIPPTSVFDTRSTNAVINTLNTATLIGGVAGVRYRLAYAMLALQQNMTGIIVGQIRDGTSGTPGVSLVVSPQCPYAFIVFPEPGIIVATVGHGIQISNISNVATQAYQMEFGYYADTIT